MTQCPNDVVEPWDRQPREGTQAFDAFVLYRDQSGRRSTHKVAQQLGKSDTLVHRWCSRWRWVWRVREYDHHLDQQARQAHEQDILDCRKRTAQQSREKAQSLMLPDVAILAKLEAPEALGELLALPLADLIALSARCAFALPHLHKAEALALGSVPGEPVRRDDSLARAISEDPEAARLAMDLLDRACRNEEKHDEHERG